MFNLLEIRVLFRFGKEIRDEFFVGSDGCTFTNVMFESGVSF